MILRNPERVAEGRGIANRRNSFRVAKNLLRHSCSQGFKANPGLELANAYSVTTAAELTPEPAIDFNSGYVLRALKTLPRQGSKTPWRVHQNYVKDLSMLRFGRVDDGTMEFKAAPRHNAGPHST